MGGLLLRLGLALGLASVVLTELGHAQSIIGTLTLNQSQNNVYSSAYFNGSIYFGTNTQPGIVARVDATSFIQTGTLRFGNVSIQRFHTAVADPKTGYLYLGTYTAPTFVAKVDLATFTQTDLLTVTGASYVKAMTIDHNGTTPYLYVGTAQSPAAVVRINLTDFTEDIVVTASAGENNFQTVEIDTDLGMLYFGTYTSPGMIVRFATSNMTNMGAVFSPNVNSYLSSCSDRTFAYFATYATPGQVTRLNKATFTIVDVLTFIDGAAYVQAASIDLVAQLAFFGTYQTPGRVAIVDLATFTHNNRTLRLPAGADLIYTSALQPAAEAAGGTTRVFLGTGASPGVIALLDTTPTLAPTRTPTRAPTGLPTRAPTGHPTTSPTGAPVLQPTLSPTATITQRPTPVPTRQPTRSPSPSPTSRPTRQPTASASPRPTPSPTPKNSQAPTDAPTGRPTAPTGHPTAAPTPIPLGDFTGHPSPSPTLPVPPPFLPVELTAGANRATVYPGLTFQYTVTLRNLAPQKYVCDPLCHYVYGDFGLDVVLPPSLRLVQASSFSSSPKNSDFFPALSGGNVSWPNAPVGSTKSLQYKMTLEVAQAATDGAAVITAASHQNILDLAGQVVGACCVTQANPTTVTVVTTTRRPAGSNARYVNKQLGSNMAGKDGTSVVEPVFGNAGAEYCDKCRACLAAYRSPVGGGAGGGRRRRHLTSYGPTGPCSDVCQKCPSFVEVNAGDRITLQSPTVVIDGNTTVNGQMTINAPIFTVTTSGPQTYTASELSFSSAEDTIMTAGSSWLAIAFGNAGLRAGGNLALNAGGLASLKSQNLVLDTLGRSLMSAVNHTHKTAGRMLYKVGTTLEWEVVDTTTLLTGTYTVTAVGPGVPGRRRHLEGGADNAGEAEEGLSTDGADGDQRAQRALQAGPPTTMQVAPAGFSVSTQGDVNLQCADFATVATGNATVQAAVLATTTTGPTSVVAGGSLAVTTGGEATLTAGSGVAIETPGVVQTAAYAITSVAYGPFLCESTTSEIFLKAYEGVTVKTPASVVVEASRNVQLKADDTLDVAAALAVAHVAGPIETFSDKFLATTTSNIDLEAGSALRAASAGPMTLTAAASLSMDAPSLYATSLNNTLIKANQNLECDATDILTLRSGVQLALSSTGNTTLEARTVTLTATEADQTGGIDWANLPTDIGSLGQLIYNLVSSGQYDQLIKDITEALSTFSVNAFSIGLKALAKLDISAKGPVGISSDFSIGLTSKRSVSITASAFDQAPVVGSLLGGDISFNVGWRNFIPVAGGLLTNPQLKIEREKVAFRVSETEIGGPTQIDGKLRIYSDTNMIGTMKTEGAVTMSGEVNVAGEATFEGAAVFNGETTVDGEFLCNGEATFDISVMVNGAATLKGEMSVAGVATFEGEVNYGNLIGGAIEAGDIAVGDIECGAIESGDITAGDVSCGALQAGDIAVGYIEAAGCFECTFIRRRRRRRLRHLDGGDPSAASPTGEPSAAPTSEPSAAPTGEPSAASPSVVPTSAPTAAPTGSPSSAPTPTPKDPFSNHPNGLMEKAGERNSSFMYSVVGRGEEEDFGLSGPYWRMLNPLHILADFEGGASSINKSALVVDGESQFYGSVSILAEDWEGDNPHLAIGTTPPPVFRETIPAGSLLLDGEGGGRLYASTVAKVPPILRVSAACKVPSGRTRGRTRITLEHAYLFGMVGGHTSSSGAMPPTGLYVEGLDPAGGTEFVLRCQAFAAPVAGTAYIYTAELAFYHAVVAE